MVHIKYLLFLEIIMSQSLRLKLKNDKREYLRK